MSEREEAFSATLAPAGHRFVRALAQSATARTFEISAGAALLVCKRMTRRAIEDADACADFENEARVLSLLAGRGAPHLVASATDEQGPYLLLERVPYASLAAHHAARAADDPFRAHVAAAAVRALDAVHAAGVVHGDVSLENVLARDDAADARLCDFGLATLATATAPARANGAFRGTLLYAAPEVARGERCDARSDRFALAATLGHLVLGTPPRPASLPVPALLALAAEAPLDPAFARALAERVDPPLGERLASWLAFEPASR